MAVFSRCLSTFGEYSSLDKISFSRTNVMRRVLRDVANTERRMLVDSAVLRLGLALYMGKKEYSTRSRKTNREQLDHGRLASSVRASDADTTAGRSVVQ